MYRSTKRTWATAALFALGLVTLAGCGGKFAREETLPESGVSVTGTVTYNGEQVMFGLVRVSGGGKEAAGKIDADGKYTVLNCPQGEVTFSVNTNAGQGDYKAATMAGGAYKGPDGKGRGKVNLKFVEVPLKFAEPATSGLKHTLADGENKHDIVIKK
jgi:hypothetical protein